MSNHSMMCCCEIPLDDCADSCDCASSYLVNTINVPYRYAREVVLGGGWGCGPEFCTDHGQQGCGHIVHDLTLNTQLLVPFAVTKTTIGTGSNQECCYRGTGELRVYGTLEVNWEYYCGEDDCPVTSKQDTYTFDRTTCVCVVIKCAPNFPTGGCAGLPAGPRWLISIEIADFVITCNHVPYDIPFDCDPYCPIELPPVSIRCLGGQVWHLAPLECLTTLTPGDFSCAGFQQGAQGCPNNDPPPAGGSCFEFVGARNAVGPFGMITDGECSPGQDDFDCVDDTSGSTNGYYTWLRNQLPSGVSQPYCGLWGDIRYFCDGKAYVDTFQGPCQQNIPISFT